VPSTDCPKCGSGNTCEIVYGPISDEERDRLEAYSGYGYRIPLGAVIGPADEERYDRLASKKKVYRSRRRVSPACRARHCNECKNKWGLYCPKCGSGDTCPIVYRYDVKEVREHKRFLDGLSRDIKRRYDLKKDPYRNSKRFLDGLSRSAVYMQYGSKRGDSPSAYMALEPAFIGREPPADEEEHDLLAAKKKIHPGGLLSLRDMLSGGPGTTDLARHCNVCGNEWGGVYCPVCHSTSLCPVVYGCCRPNLDKFRLAAEKKIELRPPGFIPTTDWRCKRCWAEW